MICYSISLNWLLHGLSSTLTANKKGNNNKQMCLRCRPFWWLYKRGDAICIASPDSACPGLYRKPLDAAIRQLLAPCCPGGRQGNRQTNNNEKNTPTLLAVLMAMAMCLYVTMCIAQWRWSRVLLEATGCCHWASIMSNDIKGAYLRWFLLRFLLSTPRKWVWSKTMALTKNRGLTCQTN